MASDQDIAGDARLARVLLPASLLREVDQLVLSGRGGYATRQEFFLEAIQNHVLEVKHGTGEGGQLLLDRDIGARPVRVEHGGRTPDEPVVIDDGTSGDAADAPLLPAALSGAPIDPITDLDQTALHTRSRGYVVEGGVARFKKEPLFGLHNRDYPSLWALCQLAELAHEDLVPAPMFIEEATRRAWRYAQALGNLEERTAIKLTALFPTNVVKPQSAVEGFCAFAIGTIARKPAGDGTIETAGPLFSWQTCQLVKPDGTAHIGITPAGWELVEAMDGLTLAWPHERQFANRFFGHLREHAPWDWAGFEQILKAVSGSPNRAELVARFGHWQPRWSDAVANTMSSGYVARARAWGLVAPKMIDSRYTLTDFGRSMLTERNAA